MFALLAGFLRIVVADDLDELAVARAALIGDDDFVIRMVESAFAAETDAETAMMYLVV